MTAPEVWWSPSLAEDLSQGGLIERAGPDLWHQEHGTWQRLADLPGDAVRLVPESEVQFVLDDNERMLAQHAADVAEIERLREDKRLFQDMFMSSTAHNTAVCEALGLSYEAETETVVAAIQKALHPMLMLDSETGAVSLAGAVPDTGQARADHLAAGIRKFADDCKLLLESGGLDNRVARSIAQQERNLRALLAEPSGDTAQTPDVAATALRDAARLLDLVAEARDDYLDGMKEDSEPAVAIENFGSGIRSAARILRSAPHAVELLVPTWRYLGELAELDLRVRALLGADTTPEAGRA